VAKKKSAKQKIATIRTARRIVKFAGGMKNVSKKASGMSQRTRLKGSAGMARMFSGRPRFNDYRERYGDLQHPSAPSTKRKRRTSPRPTKRSVTSLLRQARTGRI
jgi:hypothetical protein